MFSAKRAKKNQGAFCCIHIIEKTRPLAYIAVDEDDDMIFSCGRTDHHGANDWATAGVWHFLSDEDIIVEDIPDLLPGECAVRFLDTNEWKKD